MKCRLLFVLSCLLSGITSAQIISPPVGHNEGLRPSTDGYTLPSVQADKQYIQNTLRFDRLDRTYLISDSKPAKPMPVIIALHPSEQTAEQFWQQTTLPEFARKNGYLLVVPQAYNNQWNDGNIATLSGKRESNIDDVGFLIQLIDTLNQQHISDPKNVFLVGVSSGGFLATHFSCIAGDMIRGGANILSTLNAKDKMSCKDVSIPWLSLNGSIDALVPFGGQSTGTSKTGQTQDILLSADQTFAFFGQRNQCKKYSKFNELPHFNPRDETKTYIRVGSECAKGTNNVMIVVQGGGHQLTNVQKSLGFPYGGRASQDIDTGTALIHFFNNIQNPKPLL